LVHGNDRPIEGKIMRITGGEARGVPLVVPRGDGVRPATDAMRQAVFSSIASWISGAKFLDLFAGTGAYGLEAVSRGAAGGVFVEKDAKTVACIRQNIAAVCKSFSRSQSELQVINADATSVSPGFVPDLIFIDPPYDLIPEVAPKLFSKLASLTIEKADPLIVFEMPGELTFSPEDWSCVKRLGKGIRQPTVCIFRTNRALL
jgi:16S rRNA (guanine966-N2)-methyltransferase